MGKSKAKAQKFDRINKSVLKNASKRTRTGAYKNPNRSAAHSKRHKH